MAKYSHADMPPFPCANPVSYGSMHIKLTDEERMADIITTNQLICKGTETGGEAGGEGYKTWQTKAQREQQPCVD